MIAENYRARLRELGYGDQASYQKHAFARNIGLITEEEQNLLQKATVAVPGMGGVGGIHLMTLVRMGVGSFHLADFDTFSAVNVNRQYGAKVPTFNKPKIETMIEEALAVNPFLKINDFPEGVTSENIERFLQGVDVVVDGVDFFEIDIRRRIFNMARESGIPVVTAGPLGFTSALLVFLPDKGMGFDDFFDISDSLSEEDKYLHYALGLAPKGLHIKYTDRSKVSLKNRTGPSSIIACQLCAGVAATEAIRLILGKRGSKGVPHYSQFDPYLQKYAKGYLWLGNRNPIQRLKKFIIKRFILQDS
ncbi:MAG: ThiF family adenylyltransferase [Desulfurivibrionaceae bacterium]